MNTKTDAEKDHLHNCYMDVILATVLFLAGIPGNASAQQAQVTLVTGPSAGRSVLHGLDKIVTALQARHIAVKKVTSISDAGTGQVIVAGLSEGSGTAAQLLKSGHHTVPQTAEALSVWKTTLDEDKHG